MDYKEMWENLKEDMVTAMDEAYAKGYNFGDGSENGKFRAYQFVIDFMVGQEDLQNIKG